MGASSFIIAIRNRGHSIYHGLAAEVERRLSTGLWFIGAFTWSENIDDCTAGPFSTLLSLCRQQGLQGTRAKCWQAFLDQTHTVHALRISEVR